MLLKYLLCVQFVTFVRVNQTKTHSVLKQGKSLVYQLVGFSVDICSINRIKESAKTNKFFDSFCEKDNILSEENALRPCVGFSHSSEDTVFQQPYQHAVTILIDLQAYEYNFIKHKQGFTKCETQRPDA